VAGWQRTRFLLDGARSAFHGSVASVCRKLARGRDRTPRLPRPKLSIFPQNPEMWKSCQAFCLRYESFLPHSTRLPSLYPQRILAGFPAGLGILIIGGKNDISAPTDPNNRPPFAAFSFSGGQRWHASTHCPTPYPPHPPAGGCQKAPARAPVSATCHSPKQPSRKPRRCNNMPQSPRGEGVSGIGFARKARLRLDSLP
jgi:hypothetical protein